VRCPVLFAWAVKDRFVSLRRNRPAIERFADVRLLECRAGHAAHLEAPEEFEAAVRGFLQRVAPRPGASATLH
jgi:pimeloyl-ACP methyl ester carboxylesterase